MVRPRELFQEKDSFRCLDHVLIISSGSSSEIRSDQEVQHSQFIPETNGRNIFEAPNNKIFVFCHLVLQLRADSAIAVFARKKSIELAVSSIVCTKTRILSTILDK